MQNPVREAAAALIRARDSGTTAAEMEAFAALRAALALPAPEPVGDWLWRELMDYCRERRMAPAGHDRLFEIVTRARSLYAEPPAPPEVWCACGDQITPESGAECGACITARAEPPAPRERSIGQTIDERLGAGWTGRLADALTEADETHAGADSDHEAGK